MSRVEAQELAIAISKQFHLTTYKAWNVFIREGHPLSDINIVAFEKARNYARSLGLKTRRKWIEHCKNQDLNKLNIPSNPTKYYKNKWVSWGDFLNNNHKVPRKFLNYEEAKWFVHSLNPRFNNCKEWDVYCKSGNKPDDIPHSPQKIYKDDGWVGWDCWFGSGLYDLDLSDEEVQQQIDFERENIAEQIELIRHDFETDEEIIDAYSREAIDIIKAVKKYLKNNPREKDE